MRPGVRPILNPTLQLTAVVDVSRRGVGRRRVDVTDERVARLLLSKKVRGAQPPRVSEALRRWLFEAGILVRPSEVPRAVHLDPRLRVDGSGLGVGRLDHRGAETFDIGLSRRCVLHRGPGLPGDVGPQAFEPFLPAEEILWVFERGSGIALPYTLTPRLIGAIRRLLRERPKHPRLPRSVVAALSQVGALDDRQEAAAHVRRWRAQVQAWREQLRVQGYVALRGLFPPIFLQALRNYYRRLEKEGYLPRSNSDVDDARLLYHEPLLNFLGVQLISVVRQVTGSRVPWTFSYLRACGPGAVIARHRDAPVCRWNVDLVVGGHPSPDRQNAWPLWIEGQPRPRQLRLGLGDALLYRGALLRHWRSAQRRSQTTLLGCLHYGAALR